MRHLGLAIACAALALPAAASATEIHAHRGGTLENGVPVTPENSLTAFQHASEELAADVIELDVKLTSDDVPVVMHDATLDRTTDCSGLVRDHTAAQVLACRIDTLGTAGNVTEAPESTELVPSLESVLAWAAEAGVRLNVEIKNIPNEPDFDRTAGFAAAVLDAVDASAIPSSDVIIQSFWPPNLDLAVQRGYTASLLTLQPMNELSPAYAALRGYEWVSPGWRPADPGLYMTLARGLGRKVVPYTLDAAEHIRDAHAAGVDALITNDVVLAQQVLAGP